MRLALIFIYSLMVLLSMKAAFAQAFKGEISSSTSEQNVLLITLDGVRWQEIFRGVDPKLKADSKSDSPELFPLLRESLRFFGLIAGNMDLGSPVRISNGTGISLPAYQSIMTGTTTHCISNSCGPVDKETFPERLINELNIERSKVAVFASWQMIERAIESKAGSLVSNAGPREFTEMPKDSEVLQINNRIRLSKVPWSKAKWDEDTMALALYYLKKKHPRFLYISLNDSDEWGHLNNYDQYTKSLRQYDFWIREIAAILENSGDYGKNTTIIVTTDHGRGDGSSWGSHGPFWSGSKNIWIYAKGPRIKSHGEVTSHRLWTHLDIRPTIEKIFGLSPLSCKECGEVISEISP